MSRVVVVGAGYVGLVTGACLADLGHEVVCVDLRRDVVDRINVGVPPIHEHGLEPLLARVAGRSLSSTTDLEQAMVGAEVVLVAVGTPTTESGIDLGPLLAAVRKVAGLLDKAADRPVVVVKSTVVPGVTAGAVSRLLAESSGGTPGVDFGVAVNPEFLTEGTAIEDFMQPDRIVIGADQDWEAERIVDLYRRLDPSVPRIVTSPSTAEMIKYVSNSMLATAISFSNEMARLADAVGGVDIVEVMQGVHASRYLTTRLPDGRTVTAGLASFLEAGCGFGGSCLPKDIAALAAHGRALGTPMRLLEAVSEVNRGQAAVLVEKVERGLGRLDGQKVGVLGLAFKPDTDDLRESPAIAIIERLLDKGARVIAHDPIAIPRARQELAALEIDFADDLADLIPTVDVLVLVTRWEEYLAVPRLVSELARPPLVVDGRGVLDPASLPRYVGVGR